MMRLLRPLSLLPCLYSVTLVVLVIESGDWWFAAKTAAITASLKWLVTIGHHRFWDRPETSPQPKAEPAGELEEVLLLAEKAAA